MSHKGMQIASQTLQEACGVAFVFRAFVPDLCFSRSLFYVSPLVLITVKGLRVATVFISNQWLSLQQALYGPPHLHSIL